MEIVRVKEPESGVTRELKILPVNNYDYPGWVVLIPEKRNIFLYLQNGEWKYKPHMISTLYAERIGKALKKLGVLSIFQSL